MEWKSTGSALPIDTYLMLKPNQVTSILCWKGAAFGHGIGSTKGCWKMLAKRELQTSYERAAFCARASCHLGVHCS
eukprot:1920904-Amphidinium_carterae.1